MSTEVTLPALGESVTEGTVSRWLKAVGDSVAADEPLLEVSTDKVDTEIPSPTAGTLLEIKAQEDDTVEVGAVLGVIGDESEGGGDSSSAGVEPDAEDEATPEAQLITGWDAYPDEVAALPHPHPTQSEALGEAHLALAGKPLHSHG